MKKMLVVLRGVGNAGKTTTIRMVRDHFLRKFPKSQEQTLGKYRSENVVIWILPTGLRIGICSYGDSIKQLKKPLEWFVGQECQVIICASRTEGTKTANYVNSFKKKGFNVSTIEKYRGTNSVNYDEENRKVAEDEENKKVAERIVQLIKKEVSK